ncbi:hypothetical protein HBH53_248300 [Parastagonospora nodorum]|nr:hypothetical protein HBH53_248300 [Parastagonospora nodorum]KAH4197255.1 hypothetical protein HBI95_188730 [Parastagonospora nodorum]KAH4924780.1 hypothetical protein HBI79_161430 [Parastagonospora nodorum]KAH4959755.1 hypothetical protein HBI78_164880 [Parastagonospora nodorum]KAH5035007.1 hypothetical protein HBI74_058180 [Parastagonospora nodorum]
MSSIKKTPSEDEIASTLTHLKLSTTSPQKPLHKPKSKPVADSWDDEDASSGSDTETESADTKPTLSPISTVASNEISPHPPPPTPASPTPFELPYGNVPGARGSARAGSIDKRPEKTTAVAGRLIAGALGVRAPKRTEEEREFDKAVREKERRRRAEEKEREAREKEEVERRKKAVWDD